MCESCGTESAVTVIEKSRKTFTRRAAVAGLGAVVGGGVLAACTTPAPGLNQSSAAATGTRSFGSLSIVLLGTQGGPPPVVSRTGIGSAVYVDGKTYIVDLGRSTVTQYVKAGLKLAEVGGVFLTHLHADHVADYYNLFLLGGNAPQTVQDSLPNTTPVYGPGSAGGLPPTFGGGNSPTLKPSNPTPGLAELTAHCNDAFAYSTNVFLRDSHIRETSGLMDVHEIPLPNVGASFTNTAPTMKPFTVMEDDRVKVTAILVPHGPVFPAFAYRFDTDHGSVTFSGDTTYTENIPTLAKRSDLLVHESINIQGFRGPEALKSHLLSSHVEVQKVGTIAQKAEVSRLVLSHIGDLASPQEVPVKRWMAWAQKGFDGKAAVGSDGQVIRLA